MSANEADFIVAITKPKTKRHLAEADWRQRTLCGQPTILREHMAGDDMKQAWDDMVPFWPACKQCDKSKARRIAGRSS